MKAKQAAREAAAYRRGQIEGYAILLAASERQLADLDDVIEAAKANGKTQVFTDASELRDEVLADIDKTRVAQAALEHEGEQS